MGWSETYPHSIFVSVILVDNKIADWKIGQHTLSTGCLIDTTKCDYKEKEFVVNSNKEHNKVFEKDSIDWLRQWKVHEKYRGHSPFDDIELRAGDIISFGNHEMKIIGHVYTILSFILFFVLLNISFYYISIFLGLYLLIEIIVEFSRF